MGTPRVRNNWLRLKVATVVCCRHRMESYFLRCWMQVGPGLGIVGQAGVARTLGVKHLHAITSELTGRKIEPNTTEIT